MLFGSQSGFMSTEMMANIFHNYCLSHIIDTDISLIQFASFYIHSYHY